jgi:hypothetical protein
MSGGIVARRAATEHPRGEPPNGEVQRLESDWKNLGETTKQSDRNAAGECDWVPVGVVAREGDAESVGHSRLGKNCDEMSGGIVTRIGATEHPRGEPPNGEVQRLESDWKNLGETTKQSDRNAAGECDSVPVGAFAREGDAESVGHSRLEADFVAVTPALQPDSVTPAVAGTLSTKS